METAVRLESLCPRRSVLTLADTPGDVIPLCHGPWVLGRNARGRYWQPRGAGRACRQAGGSRHCSGGRALAPRCHAPDSGPDPPLQSSGRRRAPLSPPAPCPHLRVSLPMPSAPPGPGLDRPFSQSLSPETACPCCRPPGPRALCIWSISVTRGGVVRYGVAAGCLGLLLAPRPHEGRGSLPHSAAPPVTPPPARQAAHKVCLWTGARVPGNRVTRSCAPACERLPGRQAVRCVRGSPKQEARAVEFRFWPWFAGTGFDL